MHQFYSASLTKCFCAVKGFWPDTLQHLMLDKEMLVRFHPNLLFLDHQGAQPSLCQHTVK